MRMHKLYSTIRSILFRRRVEAEVAEELRFHVEERARHLAESDGVSPDEAIRRARMEFGAREKYREEARQSFGLHHFDVLVQDVRYSMRGLRRDPRFALTAILTLALGIGATTVVFSVVDSFLFNASPFDDSDRLVQIYSWSDSGGGPGQRAEVFMRWREQAGLFEQMEGHIEQEFVVTGGEQAESLWGDRLTPGMFRLLGVRPQIGRLFASDEASARLVVLSHGLWGRRFGGDPRVLGDTMQVDGEPHAVIGVMPPDFRFPSGRPEFWLPLDVSGLAPRETVRPVARLRDGLSFQVAEERVSATAAEIDPSLADSTNNRTARLQGFNALAADSLLGQLRPNVRDRQALLLIFGAGGVLLLASAANAANLFLSRSVSRRPDFAVRAALGGSRPRLIRQVVTEALMISGLSGLLGFAAAYWLVALVASVVPSNLVESSLNPLDLDFRAGIWTLAASLSAGLLASILPALGSTGRQLVAPLKKSVARFEFRRLGHGSLLTAGETALAVVLLVAAGLVARTLWTLTTVDTGWTSENVLVIQPGKPTARGDYDLVSELQRQVDAIPGTESTAIAYALPLELGMITFGATSDTAALPENVTLIPNWVSDGYFDTLKMTVQIAPEQFDSLAPDDALIAWSMADRLWPGENPIGKVFQVRVRAEPDAIRVAGIVGDVQSGAFDLGTSGDPLEYYQRVRPDLEAYQHPRFIVVRSDGRPGMGDDIRRRIAEFDRDLPVSIRSMDQIFGSTLDSPRLHTMLFGGFALMVLLLAAAGVYAVVSYEANRRNQEMGIRIALGATARNVVGHVLQRSLRDTMVGVAIGLATAAALTRIMESILAEVEPLDPAAFAGATVVLLAAVFTAAYLPARRAARVNPVECVGSE